MHVIGGLFAPSARFTVSTLLFSLNSSTSHLDTARFLGLFC